MWSTKDLSSNTTSRRTVANTCQPHAQMSDLKIQICKPETKDSAGGSRATEPNHGPNLLPIWPGSSVAYCTFVRRCQLVFFLLPPPFSPELQLEVSYSSWSEPEAGQKGRRAHLHVAFEFIHAKKYVDGGCGRRVCMAGPVPVAACHGSNIHDCEHDDSIVLVVGSALLRGGRDSGNRQKTVLHNPGEIVSFQHRSTSGLRAIPPRTDTNLEHMWAIASMESCPIRPYPSTRNSYNCHGRSENVI